MKRTLTTYFSAGMIFACLLFVAQGDLSADILYLRDGRVVLGKVVGQTRVSMKVRTATGIQSIRKRSIRKVSYDKAEEKRIVRRRESERRAREQARLEKARLEKERLEKARLEKAVRERREMERRKREKLIAAAARKKKNESAARAPGIRRPASSPGADALERLRRSAILPGWGLLSAQRPNLGYGYMGAAMGSLLYAFLASNAAATARTSSNNASAAAVAASNSLFTDAGQRLAASFALSAPASAEYSTELRSANRALGLFALIYLAQLAHSYFLGPGIMPVFARGNPKPGAPDHALETGPAGAATNARLPGSESPVRLGFRVSIPFDF